MSVSPPLVSEHLKTRGGKNLRIWVDIHEFPPLEFPPLFGLDLGNYLGLTVQSEFPPLFGLDLEQGGGTHGYGLIIM